MDLYRRRRNRRRQVVRAWGAWCLSCLQGREATGRCGGQRRRCSDRGCVFPWEQHRWPILLIGFVLCGLGIGFAETGEATVVARLLPEHLRSNGFGVLGLVQSFGDLGATMITEMGPR